MQILKQFSIRDIDALEMHFVSIVCTARLVTPEHLTYTYIIGESIYTMQGTFTVPLKDLEELLNKFTRFGRKKVQI